MVRHMSAPPRISIVITALEKGLSGLAEGLAQVIQSGDEVLLASRDPIWLSRAQDLARQAGPGHQALVGGRAQAANQARGEVILFLEADWRPQPALLDAVRVAFAQPEPPAALALPLGLVSPASPWADLAGLDLAWDQQRLGPPQDCGLAVVRRELLAAGGLDPDREPGGADLFGLWLRLEEMGRPLAELERAELRLPAPAGFWGAMELAWDRARRLYSRLRLGGPARRGVGNVALQVGLWLLALGLLAAFATARQPERGLSLAAICLLLLYYSNRSWLRWLGDGRPDLLGRALVYGLLRPLAWLGGMLTGLGERLGGKA